MDNVMQIMEARHSVRQYTDKKIDGEVLGLLKAEIDQINRTTGVDFQLILDEPGAFSGFLPRYGKFQGVSNYVGLIAPKSPNCEEKVGFLGERLVLKAQQLGLNTCWVGLSYSRRKLKLRIPKNEKLYCVLALGYGSTQGIRHKSRKIDDLTDAAQPRPEWFLEGMKAAMLAPTTVNQQRFKVSLTDDGRVRIVSTGGFYSKMDLGIVKYQFEQGAGKDFPGFTAG